MRCSAVGPEPMRRSLLFAALALCAFRTVPPSSIRHLTFDVAYRSTSEAEIRYDDFDRSGTRLVLGPEVRRHGTIDVSVVAAPADGKLVVDVSERADLAATVESRAATEQFPPVRATITGKDLVLPPRAKVSEEEVALLHYLARDFVVPRTLDVGAVWRENSHENGTHVDITNRVCDVDAAAGTIRMTMAGTTYDGRSGGVDVDMFGSMTYDVASLVPRDLTLHVTTVTEDYRRIARIVSDFSATLASDSFASHEPRRDDERARKR